MSRFPRSAVCGMASLLVAGLALLAMTAESFAQFNVWHNAAAQSPNHCFSVASVRNPPMNLHREGHWSVIRNNVTWDYAWAFIDANLASMAAQRRGCGFGGRNHAAAVRAANSIRAAIAQQRRPQAQQQRRPQARQPQTIDPGAAAGIIGGIIGGIIQHQQTRRPPQVRQPTRQPPVRQPTTQRQQCPPGTVPMTGGCIAYRVF